ncbi:diadenosine tetraphosphate hydrolase [Candidatus Berkelbacteria bacterium CG08_land_8_20_14_0_20_39_8]|uniref:Diadenosine tetraphosphate hydrolase n=1 Tax=Candidatus Berkelbacteria bacterium CG08_land_8_20_14_0_20_39_8 TaxID=1974511 RepID=A0A2M6YBK3_9BACT|nr:MAG: diadenosine tetraphosphate hydrolase [Candidatus Berkelbacteria bacterium CG08_land_8_20_14_0_20_39_8]
MHDDCIFCKIVAGEISAHKIWEDENHLAFLGIFPNTEGMTVVVTKRHYPSYAFDSLDNILSNLIIAAKKVAKLLDLKLDDVGRTALVLEGFGVDHLHAKLFPMHGTKMKKWKPIHSNINTYFKKYSGYISSHDSKKADDKSLEKLAKKIRN